MTFHFYQMQSSKKKNTDIRIISDLHTNVKPPLKNPNNWVKLKPGDLRNFIVILNTQRALSFAPESQTFTPVHSEYFLFDHVLNEGGQWQVELNSLFIVYLTLKIHKE